MKTCFTLTTVMFLCLGAQAAEPPAQDKAAGPAAAAPSAPAKAQADVRRKPYSKAAPAATGPGTQTEDDVYVGVKKK